MERPGIAIDLLTVHLEQSISLQLSCGAAAVIKWKLVNYGCENTDELLPVVITLTYTLVLQTCGAPGHEWSSRELWQSPQQPVLIQFLNSQGPETCIISSCEGRLTSNLILNQSLNPCFKLISLSFPKPNLNSDFVEIRDFEGYWP